MGLKRNKQKGISCQDKPFVHIKDATTGITLVALVVTIVVLLILAGITINYVFSDNGIFAKASEAKFKTRWTTYKEQVDTYATWKMASTMSSNIDDINAGDTLLELIEVEAEGVDIRPEDVNSSISDIVNNLASEDKRYAVVYHGELCYVKEDRNKNGEKEAKWCEEVGIPVLELERPSGIAIKDGSYEYVNGVYLCTPDLTGFNKNYTRYVNETADGKMLAQNWVFDKATEDWYDYTKGRWANVLTEQEGIECYYTWIPRYCFKLNSGTQRADVKLVDMNNNYKDPYTDEVTTWDTLKSQGYQVPEAFTFNEKPVAGYWAMKYNLGDAPATPVIFFDKSVTKGIITISNMKITNGGDIKKIVVNLNSKQQGEPITDIANVNSLRIRLDNMKKGDNVINLTGYNNQGEIVASYTTVYASSVHNPPDLTAFDKEHTFYVTYDEQDNEHSTVLIKEEVPKGWYNYDSAEWANVVVRRDDAEIYYTWIPRYEFILKPGNQRSEVKFITGTGGGTDAKRSGVSSGYQVPEAFKFDGKEVTGYWAMKYNLGDPSTDVFDAHVVASSSSTITVQGIRGTGTSASGLVYNYYIDDKPIIQDTTPYKTTKSASERVTFENLSPGREYMVLIEVRNSSGGYVSTIVKRLTISEPNKPDLTGFNPECTYYVTYNGNTETIGEKIKNDGSNMPDGWYNYSQEKWANIVTQNGGTKTYYTWIPRYQFKVNGQTQRCDVRFLPNTSTTVLPGYQVPEAFTFNGKPLTGYWAMKYNVGE